MLFLCLHGSSWVFLMHLYPIISNHLLLPNTMQNHGYLHYTTNATMSAYWQMRPLYSFHIKGTTFPMLVAIPTTFKNPWNSSLSKSNDEIVKLRYHESSCHPNWLRHQRLPKGCSCFYLPRQCALNGAKIQNNADVAKRFWKINAISPINKGISRKIVESLQGATTQIEADCGTN